MERPRDVAARALSNLCKDRCVFSESGDVLQISRRELFSRKVFFISADHSLCRRFSDIQCYRDSSRSYLSVGQAA